MELTHAVVLALAGLAAGFINTLAGGGSSITLPALEWVTGSPGVANATNRIAILLQNVVAVAGFHTGKAVPFKLALRLSLPAIVGGCGGAWTATVLAPGAMRVALSLGIAFVAVTAVVRPPRTPKLHGVGELLAFFLAGFYSGFLQVGVGFLLLACLVGGLSLDLVKANAIKVFIVLVVTVPVLVIFGLRGQLYLAEGLVLACGNMGGAWIASRLALKKGAAWIRVVIVIAAIVAVTKLLVFPSGPR
ncbi:MAG: sulfite exporter TauE/SafE family protein [Planctomycetota bacterium]